MTDLPADAGPVLTSLARAAIAQALGLPGTTPPGADWLHQPGAAFVTLTQSGALRGCIGSLAAYRPLVEDVTANAVSAARRDPRFPPLSADELPRTQVEVSVLSAPEPYPVSSEQDARDRLRPGIDGVVLSFGRHRGTFLPQVWEQLPQPQDFLNHLKRKAGLPSDWWDDAVRLERYTVTAFHES
ncbi:MAG: AmmeMemoRadiSam system protein A [Actinomycetia bacterium]|nr:AmmeMemoRadiSam system protein A [Actinomycetes bacterium]